MELAIKIVITLIAAVMVWGIASFTVTVWRSHIDPKKTLENLLAKVQEKPTEVLATRDLNVLYQGGEAVGQVLGKIIEAGDTVTFQDISDTSRLDRTKEIEFRRLRLRIESIESTAAMKLIASHFGSSMRTAVMSNVRCRIVLRGLGRTSRSSEFQGGAQLPSLRPRPAIAELYVEAVEKGRANNLQKK